MERIEEIARIIQTELGKESIDYDQSLIDIGMESIIFVRIIVALEMKYGIPRRGVIYATYGHYKNL